MSFLRKVKNLLFGSKDKENTSIKITEIFPEKDKNKSVKENHRDKSSQTDDNLCQKPINKSIDATGGKAVKSRTKVKESKVDRKDGAKIKARSERVKKAMSNINPDTVVAADMGDWSLDEFQVEAEEGKTRFHDLNIPKPIMRGIYEAGYKYATPIQSLILPESFKGTDVSGKAQTGTGKTAAFLITVFKHLLENLPKEPRKAGSPRALIMAPTRELVIQIEKDAAVLGKYTGLTVQSVFGGINYEKQRRQLEDRVIDILAATPGRLLDYKEQGVLKLDNIEILVIDEADRMLDMGFIPDMRKIINSAPPKSKRQTMLFSATLSTEILNLASQWTKEPLSFEVESNEITADAIEQRAYIITDHEKFAMIYNMIQNENLTRVIVFGNRRDEVSRLADKFKAVGIKCGVLSGDVSQAGRIRTLEDLRQGNINVLVATDVAARGIHVDDVSHVFNYSLPDDPEDYVHRIGRTGRAGAEGVSVIFATEEGSYAIPKIEEFTGHKLSYINPEESLTLLPPEIEEKLSTTKSAGTYAKGKGGRFKGADKHPLKRKK
ncbi:MAG: DEAD/DEAH box helicase [Deferribacterales bacterium]|nr:DEAD/DEAH box helicase [Deferribacterales bacterium]